MKSLVIDSCSFGNIIINGKTYTDDLVIYPDGRIMGPWWRKQGHQLSIEDIGELIDSKPDVIVAGTGVNGRVIPNNSLEKALSELAIKFIAAENQEALDIFNKLSPKKKVGACFHLTC